MRKLALISLFCLIASVAISSTIDSLNGELKNAKTKKDSIINFILLSDELRLSIPREALSSAKKALFLSEEEKDTLLIVRSLNRMAMCQKEQGLSNTALGTVIRALTLLQSIKEDVVKADTYIIAGHVYGSLFQYKESVEFYHKAIELFEKLNDTDGLCYCYSGLGIIYYDQQQYKKAYENYIKADTLWRDGDGTLRADLWNNLGAVCIELNQKVSAGLYYKQALEYYEKQNWYSDIAMVRYNLGELYMLLGDYEKSEEYYKGSLRMGKIINSGLDIMWGWYGLYELKKQMNEHEKALAYYEKYETVKDSLDKVQNKKEVVELELLYIKDQQAEKIKKQELELQRANAEAHSHELKDRLLYGLVLFLLIIGGVIVYYSLKMKKVNTKLLSKNHEIRQKNRVIDESLKEKEVLLKEIHHRVKNNLQIISSLLNLQKHQVNDEEVKIALEESKNRIQSIALIHKKMYQSDDLSEVDFKSYIEELIEFQKGIFESPNLSISFSVDIPEFRLDLDRAVPLGLVVSEIITNTYKHAFKNVNEGCVKIHLNQIDNKKELVISDTGKGFNDSVLNIEKNSLGLDLINTLAEQIDATVSIENTPGATYKITFS